MTWTADRQLVFVGHSETIVWDLGSPNAPAALWPGTDLAPVVTTRIDSGGLVVGAGDGGAEVFDVDLHLQRSFRGAGTPDVPPIVSGDGRTLARPVDGAVEIVDVATGAGRATGPAGFDRPLALTNDGQLLVVGTPRNPDDGQSIVAAVDAATGEQLFRIGSLHDGERGAFTSDEEVALIPISPHDADPGLWAVDASTGRRIGWGPPERCITAVAVSADDTTAATVGCDGRVSLYDIATLKGPEPWTARIGGAADDRAPGVGVTFGPDDETVIVTRQDGRVEAYSADSEFARLWSFDVGDHVGIPSVRDGMVWVGATSPYVSAEAATGGVIAMPLDLDELVAFARGSLTRELTDGECQEYLDRPSCADT
jgi:hypothetical protein